MPTAGTGPQQLDLCRDWAEICPMEQRHQRLRPSLPAQDDHCWRALVQRGVWGPVAVR